LKSPFVGCPLLFIRYCRLQSISGDHFIHRNIRKPRTLFAWIYSVRLMMHSNFHHNYHHHLVFSLAVIQLFNINLHSQVHNSIINALLSLRIHDSSLTFIISFTPYCHSLYHSLLTDIHYIIHSLLTFSISFTPYSYSVYHSFLTDIQYIIHFLLTTTNDKINYITPETGRERYINLNELNKRLSVSYQHSEFMIS